MKFCFGDVVVVDENKIGVVVKSWIDIIDESHSYDVYVRMYNKIVTYKEHEIERYMVRHKYLNAEELSNHRNTMIGI